MKIINLLEFPVNIVDENGVIVTLPPSVMDVLPNEQPGVYYLTTKQAAQVAGRAGGRCDQRRIAKPAK